MGTLRVVIAGKLCSSQRFFYVPLQVSEMALPFMCRFMRAMRDAQSPVLKGEK